MENLIIVAVINKDKQYLVTVGENYHKMSLTCFVMNWI